MNSIVGIADQVLRERNAGLDPSESDWLSVIGESPSCTASAARLRRIDED